jgi:elongation factor G
MPLVSAAGGRQGWRMAATPILATPETDAIRNVVLVGHSGSGKTTLVEALLAHTGAIPRMGTVEAGTTTSDFDEVETGRQRSVNLTLCPVDYPVGGTTHRINLLDTPGFADFVGELRAGLRGADAALFVVSAVDGVDGSTRLLWEECAAVGMPRAIVVTKLDNPRADFDEAVAICKRVFGDGVHALDLVLHEDDGQPAGLINLITHEIAHYTGGGRAVAAADPEHIELVAEQRNELLEAIIAESEDEGLMDRYLAGEEIDLAGVIADLEKAVETARFFPVLASASLTGLGLVELLDLIARGFPSPKQHHTLPAVTGVDGSPQAPLTCDPDGPLVAEVLKTTTDPFVGKLSLVRVFSGRIAPEQVLHVSGHAATLQGADRGHADHDVDEKAGSLSSPLGKNLRTVSELRAGDIGVVAKLVRAETGDTLSAKERPLLMAPWLLPEPLYPIAIVAKNKADEDKLAQGIQRLVAEDPTLRLDQNAMTHQLVLWCVGDAHAEVSIERLAKRYGVAVDAIEVRISLRETFTTSAKGHGRHVKQSGGHGQYAVCDIEVAPLPQGSGFQFVDKVVGGAVPRQFIPSVEKGVRAQMERGLVAGYPVVDIQVTLYDGKAHSVDSSDAAFQMAGALALKEAAANAKVSLLEPIDRVDIDVDDEYVGSVMGDLPNRRGRVIGTAPVGTGRTRVEAEIPQIELTRYPVDLRSLSHGTGIFHRAYARHEPVPSQVAAKLTADAPKE